MNCDKVATTGRVSWRDGATIEIHTTHLLY